MTKTDTEILQRFGGNLKKIRNAKGFTLRGLKDHCGISNSKISAMEQGNINVTILTVVKLAEALEVDPATLISRKALNL